MLYCVYLSIACQSLQIVHCYAPIYYRHIPCTRPWLCSDDVHSVRRRHPALLGPQLLALFPDRPPRFPAPAASPAVVFVTVRLPAFRLALLLLLLWPRECLCLEVSPVSASDTVPSVTAIRRVQCPQAYPAILPPGDAEGAT